MEWNFQQGLDNLIFILGIYGAIAVAAAIIFLLIGTVKVIKFIAFKIKTSKKLKKSYRNRISYRPTQLSKK